MAHAVVPLKSLSLVPDPPVALGEGSLHSHVFQTRELASGSLSGPSQIGHMHLSPGQSDSCHAKASL